MAWRKRGLWLMAGLLIGGSVLWMIAATASERVIAGWLMAREAEGWQVTYEGLETGGYPTRLTTRFEALQLADPGTGWAWNAPELSLTQPVLRPNSVRVVWPEEQVVASPFTRATITADQFEAHGAIDPFANLALRDGSLDLAALAVEGPGGEGVRIATGQGQLDRVDDDAEGQPRYALRLDLSELDPGPALRTLLDPVGLLPERMQGARIEAEMAFDVPWDLDALEMRRPQPRAITLDEASAEWGEMRFRSAGSLIIDAEGIPEGQLTIRAENWRNMLDLAENAGQLPPEMRGLVETTLGFLAGGSGSPEDIDAPLHFRGGQVMLGPFPLGLAPRLVLR